MAGNQNFVTRKWPTPFRFLKFFFHLSFFSFSFLFAAVIGLLLGLLAVKKTSKKASSRWAMFTTEQPRVVAGNFAVSFSLNFWSIFVHISGSITPITLIWYYWKDLFLVHQLNIDDANFGQNGWHQKWKKGQGSSRAVTAGTGVKGLKK